MSFCAKILYLQLPKKDNHSTRYRMAQFYEASKWYSSWMFHCITVESH